MLGFVILFEVAGREVGDGGVALNYFDIAVEVGSTEVFGFCKLVLFGEESDIRKVPYFLIVEVFIAEKREEKVLEFFPESYNGIGILAVGKTVEGADSVRFAEIHCELFAAVERIYEI